MIDTSNKTIDRQAAIETAFHIQKYRSPFHICNSEVLKTENKVIPKFLPYSFVDETEWGILFYFEYSCFPENVTVFDIGWWSTTARYKLWKVLNWEISFPEIFSQVIVDLYSFKRTRCTLTISHVRTLVNKGDLACISLTFHVVQLEFPGFWKKTFKCFNSSL